MIDYEHPSPETLKEWKREYRNECRREMTQYLKRFPDVTSEEKRDLSSWVRSGHSPYDNGWYIADDSGLPMDFINARRFHEEFCQEFLKDPEKFRNTSGDGSNSVPCADSDSDLPF